MLRLQVRSVFLFYFLDLFLSTVFRGGTTSESEINTPVKKHTHARLRLADVSSDSELSSPRKRYVCYIWSIK